MVPNRAAPRRTRSAATTVVVGCAVTRSVAVVTVPSYGARRRDPRGTSGSALRLCPLGASPTEAHVRERDPELLERLDREQEPDHEQPHGDELREGERGRDPEA